jgi:death-on-curing protein
MKYLSKKDILKIHKEIEKLYDIDSTLLLPSNLESALEAPKTVLYGQEIYPTLLEKVSVLMSRILKLHPFTDGNNRTGFTAAVVFLERNGRKLKRINPEVEEILCRKTSECDIDIPELYLWFLENSRMT